MKNQLIFVLAVIVLAVLPTWVRGASLMRFGSSIASLNRSRILSRSSFPGASPMRLGGSMNRPLTLYRSSKGQRSESARYGSTMGFGGESLMRVSGNKGLRSESVRYGSAMGAGSGSLMRVSSSKGQPGESRTRYGSTMGSGGK